MSIPLPPPPQSRFERLAHLARTILHAPFLGLVLIEADYFWSDGSREPPEQLYLHMAPFSALCFRTGQTQYIGDTVADPRFASNALVQSWPELRSICCAPIRTSGMGPAATLWVASPETNAFSAADLISLSEFARLMELDIRAHYAAELKLGAPSNTRLSGLSNVDSLTGLANRSSAELQLQQELNHACVSGGNFSALMCTADGLAAEDENELSEEQRALVRSMGRNLASALRPSDFVSRAGPVEFLIVARNCEKDEALSLAEQVRQYFLSSLPEDAAAAGVTLSFGVATAGAGDMRGVEGLWDSCCSALQMAQRDGGNCVRSTNDLVIS